MTTQPPLPILPLPNLDVGDKARVLREDEPAATRAPLSELDARADGMNSPVLISRPIDKF